MRPTEILSAEHRVIEQALACLEKMAQRAESGGALSEEHARDAIDFFRNFADRCHHGKEETHLFPAMEARGFSRDSGPTGVMLNEHNVGRQYIRGMEELLPKAVASDIEARRQFSKLARSYVEMLRQHIEKEDHCLFRMAEEALTEEDQKALLAAFDHVETEHMGAGTHEKFLQVANRLADHYGVPRAQSNMGVPSPGCGCGHH